MSLSTPPSLEKQKDSEAATEIALQSCLSVNTGHVQMIEKPFSLLSAAALGYQITNTAVGYLLVVGNAMFGGGPLFFYGTLVIIVVAVSIAVSLGELASAFPHAGGQYFWVAQLAPPSCRRCLSYMTAIVSWASVVCVCSSASSATTTVLFQLVQMTHPDFVYKQWHGFLVFEGLNLVAALFNIYERFLPKISKTALCFSVSVAVAFFITLFAAPSSKASGHEVFVEYYNTSGWSDGIAFFVGINVVNWSFSCLDAATHLAEEIPNPRINIPKALLVSVTISIFAGILTVLAIFFAATDLPNEFSIVQVLYDIYHQNTACPLALGTFLMLSTWLSIVGGHTWANRIAWALGRDHGLPFSSRIGSLAPAPFHAPLWAHLWTVTWIGICGFLYLASSTVFNSFISGGLMLQQLTYSIPITLMLVKGRSVFPHGPFWLPKLGVIANVIVVAWTLVTMVFYSFPYYLPVEAGQMNYVSVVLVLVFLFAAGFWIFYARTHYVLADLNTVLH